MFQEDLALFLADFGQRCVLDGAAVTAIVDVSSFEDVVSGAVTQGPSALVTSAAAGSVGVAPGSALSAAGVSYVVRQVLQEPPDGAFTRLVLARG